MTGFSLDYWPADDPDVLRFGLEPGWKFSDIVEKPLLHGIPERVWRRREIADPAGLMGKCEMAIGNRPGELEAFTLFLNPGKGWQMSVRRKGENGWDITHPSESDARLIFALLEPVDHPDGPFKIAASRDGVLRAVEAAAEARGSLNVLLASVIGQ